MAAPAARLGSWRAHSCAMGSKLWSLPQMRSLVTNYRTTFTNEVQQKGSLGAVIDSLARRNAEALSAKHS